MLWQFLQKGAAENKNNIYSTFLSVFLHTLLGILEALRGSVSCPRTLPCNVECVDQTYVEGWPPFYWTEATLLLLYCCMLTEGKWATFKLYLTNFAIIKTQCIFMYHYSYNYIRHFCLFFIVFLLRFHHPRSVFLYSIFIERFIIPFWSLQSTVWGRWSPSSVCFW